MLKMEEWRFLQIGTEIVFVFNKASHWIQIVSAPLAFSSLLSAGVSQNSNNVHDSTFLHISKFKNNYTASSFLDIENLLKLILNL